jgi:hypothetical protein
MQDFSLLHSVQTDSGAHPVSYSTDTGALSPGCKATPASVGLLFDHEDGGEMFFRNVRLSEHMLGGTGENYENLSVLFRPHCILSVP